MQKGRASGKEVRPFCMDLDLVLIIERNFSIGDEGNG